MGGMYARTRMLDWQNCKQYSTFRTPQSQVSCCSVCRLYISFEINVSPQNDSHRESTVKYSLYLWYRTNICNNPALLSINEDAGKGAGLSAQQEVVR